MKNTAIWCLKALASNGWLNPRTLARVRWPSSRQPAKKEATIRRHLDELVRSGFARKVGDYYRATDAGTVSAQTASERCRPTTLRIAR